MQWRKDEYVAERIGIGPGWRLLDLGCGRQRSWAERGNDREANLTDLERWFQSFTLLRNSIAQGMS